MRRFLSELMEGVMELETLRVLSEWTQAITSFVMWIPAIVYAWRGGTAFNSGVVLSISFILGVLACVLISLFFPASLSQEGGGFPDRPAMIILVVSAIIYGVIFGLLVAVIRYVYRAFKKRFQH